MDKLKEGLKINQYDKVQLISECPLRFAPILKHENGRNLKSEALCRY